MGKKMLTHLASGVGFSIFDYIPKWQFKAGLLVKANLCKYKFEDIAILFKGFYVI